jgi:predicted nucleotidyltransferase
MTGAQKLLHLLVEAKVNFIVVGAYATIAQGAQQRTDDLDICHERSSSNYKKLIGVLKPLHPRLVDIPPGLKVPFDEGSLAQGTNFTLITDEGRLDLLGELSAVGGYHELLASSKQIEVAGIPCRVASLELVIRSKEAANRPKDRQVLPELRALLELRKQRGT